MLDRIIRKFIQKPCEHNRNYTNRRWVEKDGTLMVDFKCRDCGYSDRGHVYGDDSDNTWTANEICTNGIKLKL